MKQWTLLTTFRKSHPNCCTVKGTSLIIAPRLIWISIERIQMGVWDLMGRWNLARSSGLRLNRERSISHLKAMAGARHTACCCRKSYRLWKMQTYPNSLITTFWLPKGNYHIKTSILIPKPNHNGSTQSYQRNQLRRSTNKTIS